MTKNFSNCIKEEFINQIKSIIEESKEEAKQRRMTALEQFVLVNKKIDTFVATANDVIRIDESLREKITELKKPLEIEVQKAFKVEVQKIIDSGTENVALQIQNLMNSMKKQGITFEEKKNKLYCEEQEEPSHVLVRERRSSYRDTISSSYSSGTSCNDDSSCGGGSGCGGGGC